MSESETALFVVTLQDDLARKYFNRKNSLAEEEDADFYFLLPKEFEEYDPSKMVFIFDQNALRHEYVKLFVDDWYPFSSAFDLEQVLVEACENYMPYVVLFRLKREDFEVIESIECVKDSFTDVYYADLFDLHFSNVQEIQRLSSFFGRMRDFFESFNPFLKSLETKQKSQGYS